MQLCSISDEIFTIKLLGVYQRAFWYPATLRDITFTKKNDQAKNAILLRNRTLYKCTAQETPVHIQLPARPRRAPSVFDSL